MTVFALRFQPAADKTMDDLENGLPGTAKRLKQVRKTLAYLSVDPRHPSLNSHEYESYPGYAKGTKVWDSYVSTGADAWRIYWVYGPNEKDDEGTEIPVITLLEIGPHR